MNDVEKIKNSIKISDLLLGELYELKKDGDNKYKTKCLNSLHTDENPTFSIKDNIGWFKCFACGIEGDIFNILDYIKPEINNFRGKIEFLQKKYLGKVLDKSFFLQGNLTKKENIQDDKDFREIMNYIAKYWSLKLTKEIKDKYILNNKKVSYKAFKGEIITMQGYGLNNDIIKNYKLGFSPNRKELYNELSCKFNKELIEKTGLFDNKGMPIFKGRIVIPYIVNGDVVFFTARQTEFTPINSYEEAKYKNQSIDNKYLYNQSDLKEYCLFITESEFDTLALKNIGYNSVSIGGLEKLKKFNDKLISMLYNVELIYIMFDNDKNLAGNNKAKELKKILLNERIDSFIINLPLEYNKKKIDINEYLGNHSKQDFDKLLIF